MSTHGNTTSDEVLINLRKIIQAIDVRSKKLSQTCGVTGPQLVVLKEIVKTEGRTIGIISRNVSLSQPTTTTIIDRLESKGFITKKRDVVDKRKIFIHPTEDGINIVNDAPSLLQDEFIQEFNKLETWEQTLMLSILQRIVTMMDIKSYDDTFLFV